MLVSCNCAEDVDCKYPRGFSFCVEFEPGTSSVARPAFYHSTIASTVVVVEVVVDVIVSPLLCFIRHNSPLAKATFSLVTSIQCDTQQHTDRAGY